MSRLYKLSMLIICILSGLLQTSCITTLNQVSDYINNRALWDRHGFSDYQFTLVRGGLTNSASTVVTVTNGQVSSPIDPKLNILTIDGYFEQIQENLMLNMPVIDYRVSYDTQYGFPINITDIALIAFDAYNFVEIKNFVPGQ